MTSTICLDLSEILDENMESYSPLGGVQILSGGARRCLVVILRSKTSQLVHFLEFAHHLGTEVVEIGSLRRSVY